ncbi:MAG TPA: stage II sporulation protein M, partial [Streptosporangiaceae bacterium]
LSAVFLAAGVGLRLGWTVVDPGPRPRVRALAEEGRSFVTAVIGLACVLLVSGLIEAFVTPSPLPPWARIGIGGVAEAAFLAYVIILGRRAVAAGETGDVDAPPDEQPIAG